MRHHRVLFSMVFAGLALVGCGGGEVTVEVMSEGSEGELQPVADQVISFLPFDRDSIFDALDERAEEPEPEIPQDLQTAFDSVGALQERWRDAESQWAEVRDSLQQISNRLQGMDPRGREYRQLFERFNALEDRERRLNRAKNEAFERFDGIQKATLARADSLRAVREAWADLAYQDYIPILDSILEAEGKEIREDTTDAEGRVTVRLGAGQWWVHTRLPVPFGELYWNVPIDPAEVDTLRLTPENAEERLRL